MQKILQSLGTLLFIMSIPIVGVGVIRSFERLTGHAMVQNSAGAFTLFLFLFMAYPWLVIILCIAKDLYQGKSTSLTYSGITKYSLYQTLLRAGAKLMLKPFGYESFEVLQRFKGHFGSALGIALYMASGGIVLILAFFFIIATLAGM